MIYFVVRKSTHFSTFNQQQQQQLIGSGNRQDREGPNDEELLRHQQLAIQEIAKQTLPANVPIPPPPPGNMETRMFFTNKNCTV